MTNYYKDNEDLRFYVERGIDWKQLVDLTWERLGNQEDAPTLEESKDFYKDILEMVGEFCGQEIAPRAPAIDRTGARLQKGEAVLPPEEEEIFDKIRDLDLHGMCFPRELGGMSAPLMLYFINTEIMGRADVSVMAHHSFHGGMALAMLIFSIQEGTTKVDPETGKILETRFAKYIDDIVQGKAWGCMDITEPDAGSDMANLRAVGEQDEDGNWYVSGEKIFITSGHGKYHFVIARTEKASGEDDPFAGLKGLSFFLVPTYEEDEKGNRKRIVELSRVEEKMGHHGSATCALVFDRAPAHLIGNRGEGFRYMLLLMNNARLGVGFESLGLCESAYRLARDYAAERRSMGKTIDRHEVIADYLDEMETDIQGIRALAVKAAWAEEIAQRLRTYLHFTTDRQVDANRRAEMEQREKTLSRTARTLTPLLKYLAAEKAVEMAHRCVQIHGGNGYMQEYQAEKLLRDAVVMPIYEGTSQIQSLMSMRDTLNGAIKNPQAFVRQVAQARWRQWSSRDPLERGVARVQTLSLAAQQHLIAKTAGDKVRSLRETPLTEWPEHFLNNWDPKRDFAYAMLHAERLARLLADQKIVEILWEQVCEHPDRREVLERYLERAEPRARYLHEEITSGGTRLLTKLGRVEQRIEQTGEETSAQQAEAAQ